MELSYPLVRVPFEGASKSFRLYHKQLTRELAQATAQIEALDGDGQQPGHRMDVEAAISKLTELAKKLRDLKQSAKNNVLEQQNDLESCATRAQYLETLEETKIGGDPSTRSRQNGRVRSMNDRLIADFLLGQGCLESAKIIEDSKGELGGCLENASDLSGLMLCLSYLGIGDLVDHDLYAGCQSVLKDLQAHHTASAIEWCSQNGSRLRRLQSPLEFHLRLQDFVDTRARILHLTPLAMQQEKQALRDAAIGEVQIVMATLAFEAPEKCGIEAYERMFAVDRWQALGKMFHKTFNAVYGIHDPPSLCIALHAGLSTLNTRACHLARDANLKAKLTHSGSRGKRQRREGERGDDSYEDSGNESDEVWFKPSVHDNNDDSASSSGSKKRKYTRAESPVPICPACSEVGSQLCTGLPFAYHPHSRLVCRVTQSVMDEHNPPLVLPNGRVYSKRGIELLTQRSSDGMIKCVDTQDVLSTIDVKPLTILLAERQPHKKCLEHP
ncbi:Hypothetical protein PHPALM_3547 [Phytophthora palmivora]|uniref:RING-Gid-type domain-containing protein n=1 Tax=Phytophthora palmivora TaxID=4796 RepID=A0A2P4YM40_9STRA|nr:Hypothetical protein PHPALM_3547 [Phytophthora palmivora]